MSFVENTRIGVVLAGMRKYGYVQCVQNHFHMNEQYFVQNVLRLGEAYK